jgi:hypothetical protein
MFTLQDKLNVRSGTLRYLFTFISPSFWIIIYMAIQFMKFYSYGLGMYEGVRFPSTMGLQNWLQIFIDRSIWPIVWWLPVAMGIEYILAWPLYYKYVVAKAKD